MPKTYEQFQPVASTWSGIAKLKSERKRHEKIGGSVKCGKTCPAFMTAIREQKEAIKITVQYQSVHAGHEMQGGKLRLYEEDRRNLAALLKIGVSYTNIIENIQKKYPSTVGLGLITKKCLHNVSRDFKVDESILHAEDAVSVDLQVKKMQRDSYNPVLIFKSLGSSLANNPLIKKKDFTLGIMTGAQLEFLELYGKNIIMMDSTHGTNQYGYLLTTIMVSGDNHEGLPTAVCYSNRVSSDVLEPFFEEIKKRLSHLKP
ncbi:c2H2-type domain-containing protein [Trichonephila clavipes]|nr:c2H2-type domain-containing protein [Trichonephila clavipes]